MRNFILWLLAISISLGVILTLLVIYSLWTWAGKHQIEFELGNREILVIGFTISLSLFVILFTILFKVFYDIRELLNQSPFLATVKSPVTRLNPFVTIREIIRKTNEKSRIELDKLNQLEQYRKEYIGNVSHELKTPIFNIQGYIASLLEGGLNDKKVNRYFLEKADKNVDRMINIVMDLQTISRFEAGELVLEKEPFEIGELIRDVIETEQENAEKSNISFRLFEGNKISVYADKFRIRQVITNLLVNSIRYAKPEGGETTVRIYELENSVSIEITDNGIGIDKKHLPRIFERFYRVDSSRSREKGGSGLGLAIVKHIIEAHGEHIDVMSTPGVGTIFRFSLKKILN